MGVRRSRERRSRTAGPWRRRTRSRPQTRRPETRTSSRRAPGSVRRRSHESGLPGRCSVRAARLDHGRDDRAVHRVLHRLDALGVFEGKPTEVRGRGAAAADHRRGDMSRKRQAPNQLLGHADEADGIEEYDNPLPDWWLGLFFLTIIWAFAYTVHYHFIADRSQEKALAAELAAAELRWPASAEDAVFVPTPELAEAGRSVYATNCAACHAADLTGGIGPNLVDDEWIHGGSPEDVVRTIAEGVPTKGMPAWGPILGPERVRQAAAYILTISADRGA